MGMRKSSAVGGWLLGLALVGAVGLARAEGPPTGATGLPAESALYRTQLALDQELFGAYNRCELEAFGRLLAPDIEFYHDQGGLMRGREAVVESTRKYICGKVRRELVEGSLEVHEMKGYGALVLGSHRFCELASGRCEGIARFAGLWQQQPDGRWQMTRVLSFAHRANTQ